MHFSELPELTASAHAAIRQTTCSIQEVEQAGINLNAPAVITENTFSTHYLISLIVFNKQFGATRDSQTPIEKQVRLLPVSYTHLDVYKRQV